MCSLAKLGAPSFAEVVQLRENSPKIITFLFERILDTGWYLGENFAFDEALLLEFFEALA